MLRSTDICPESCWLVRSHETFGGLLVWQILFMLFEKSQEKFGGLLAWRKAEAAEWFQKQEIGVPSVGCRLGDGQRSRCGLLLCSLG